MSDDSLVSQLTTAQVKEFTEVFNEFDQNKNGVITRDEMKQCLIKAKVHHTEEEIGIVMQSMDSNLDGVVSYKEYMKFMAQATLSTDGKSTQKS